ncbi:MAG: hypothetical protein ACR2H3_13970 [Acidimicrobiales bacterium]
MATLKKVLVAVILRLGSVMVPVLATPAFALCSGAENIVGVGETTGGEIFVLCDDLSVEFL